MAKFLYYENRIDCTVDGEVFSWQSVCDQDILITA